MQTRRDQLHAYRFMTRRAMSALVTGEPDTVEPPMRRLTVMTISGVMIAIVVAAVFAVIGLLRGGGGDGWRTDGAVIVEEETGARYVNIEGTLYPVLNFASAVLATGAEDTVQVQHVSRSDLVSVDRGHLIGIEGLPDSMPSADDLVRGPLTVCSRTSVQGIDAVAEVVVEVGAAPEGRLGDDEGAYVESFDGERFLLLGGERLPVDRQVEAALQLNVEPTKVGTAFLNAVPMGESLATPRVPSQGDSVDVGDHTMRVGQVIEVDDGTFRVALSDGIARVSDVQAKLLRTAELGGERRDPVQMSLAEVLDLEEGEGLSSMMVGLPDTMPKLDERVATTQGMCAVFTEGDALPVLAVPESGTSQAPSSESKNSRLGKVDQVDLKAGKALIATSSGSQSVHVLAAPGRVYSARSIATIGGFGYGDVDPVVLPVELLGSLPAGPALDPQQARSAVQ